MIDIWIIFPKIVQVAPRFLEKFSKIGRKMILGRNEFSFLGAKMMQMFGWEFTEDQLNAFKQMWIATDIDGDYGSRSMMEQINFLLKQWAYFIQN